ncbi:hypothetical protein [Parasutterella excrementihominis]|uniref:hypothetical protein n=1 Tax=Parasutterella excrementihominis TaxID=487175 RepID=UPI003A8E1421
MKLEDRILRLARLGMTPYQIEEQLGIKHFTIHIGYHKTLMQGYSGNEAFFERTTGEQKEKRDKLDEEHKQSKEKGIGKDRNASGADAVPGNGQGADSDQLSA